MEHTIILGGKRINPREIEDLKDNFDISYDQYRDYNYFLHYIKYNPKMSIESKKKFAFKFSAHYFTNPEFKNAVKNWYIAILKDEFVGIYPSISSILKEAEKRNIQGMFIECVPITPLIVYGR